MKFTIPLPTQKDGYKLRRLYAAESRRYHFESETRNLTTIIDAMLRVAVKLTDCYAGDIVYTIESLKKVLDAKENYCVLLSFRESGVDEFDAGYDEFGKPYVRLLEGNRSVDNDNIQLWLLSLEYISDYDVNCRFERVYLSQCDEISAILI